MHFKTETVKEKNMKVGALYSVKEHARNWECNIDSSKAGWREAPYSPVIYLGKHSLGLANPDLMGWRFLMMGATKPTVIGHTWDKRIKKFETFCKNEGYVFEEVK